jgi:hypothetical protein
MLPLRFHYRAWRRAICSVVIAGDEVSTDTEGVIEGVRRVGKRVDVRMLLSDGGSGVARVDEHEWDWLELRVGDIVGVSRLSV